MTHTCLICKKETEGVKTKEGVWLCICEDCNRPYENDRRKGERRKNAL